MSKIRMVLTMINNYEKEAIAIDGPSGAGKSSVARLLAKEIGYTHIDTGSIYRALAWMCIDRHADIDDMEQVNAVLDKFYVNIKYIDNIQRIIIDDKDITQELALRHITDMSSKLSQLPAVRMKLVNLQKEMSKKNKVVMDGRDIGSNVVPNASLKIYLDADVKIRANRRFKDLTELGFNVEYNTILKDIEERDKRDINRRYSPLIRTKDAIYLDTTYKDIDLVVKEILNMLK